MGALIAKQGSIAQRFRKAIASVGVAILSAARDDVTAAPTITSGSGVPSASEANGSIYLRTDGTDGDDSLYMRIGGSWAAILGQTA